MHTFFPIAGVMALLVVGLFSPAHGLVHTPPEEVTNPLPSRAKGTCYEKGLHLCPISGTLMRYSSHIECLVARRRKMPAWCREYVDSLERCLDDMTRLCPNLRRGETVECLAHHLPQLSWRCESSMMMMQVHEENGWDTNKYRRAYDLERRDNERSRHESEDDVDPHLFLPDLGNIDGEHPYDL